MRKSAYLVIFIIAVTILLYNANPALSRTVYFKKVLDNGLTVLIKSNPDSKVFAVNVLAKGRSALEAEGKTGLSEFVNRMMLKGTKDYDAEELSRVLDHNGVQLTLHDNPYIPYDDRYTSQAFAFVKLETIDEFAEPALGLLAQIVGYPTFPEDKIEEVRGEIQAVLGMNMGSTYKNAASLFREELFPESPYSKDVLGNMRTISSITQADLVTHHAILYAPENLIMAVAANIPPEICVQMIETEFGELSNIGYDYPAPQYVEPISDRARTHKYMDKDQVYIYYGNIVPGIDNPSYPALKIAASALSTRLKLELREEQGLAYSVGSGISLYPELGVFAASMGTGHRNFNQAFGGIRNEIRKLQTDGITEQERVNTTNSLWGSMLSRNLARINQAYYMALHEYLGVGYQYWDSYIDKLRAVTTQEVQAAAVKYIPYNNYVLATVGKK